MAIEDMGKAWSALSMGPGFIGRFWAALSIWAPDESASGTSPMGPRPEARPESLAEKVWAFGTFL